MSAEARSGAFYPPKLPRVSFAFTEQAISTPGPQPSGRMKSVTRRKSAPDGSPPRWAKVGHLFLAYRGQRLPRGDPRKGPLGVFRVSCVERVGRWQCPDCKAPRCRCRMFHRYGHKGPRETEDTLTPRELELEGVPGMEPDEFWRRLQKAGTLDDQGRCWRITFEAP